MSFTAKTATLRVDYPDNLREWGACQFSTYPDDFPHPPSAESLTATFRRARLSRPGRTPVTVKAARSFPSKTFPGGMNLTVSGSARWEAVFTPVG